MTVALPTLKQNRRCIAVDVRKIDDSGIGTYLRNIVPRTACLMPDVRFALLGNKAALTPYFAHLANCEIIVCDIPSLSIREQWLLPRFIPKGVAIYWATHFNLPLLHPGRMLVTIHDIMPLGAPGLSGGKMPEIYLRLMAAALRLRKTEIISVSRFTASELTRLARIDQNRITVIHEGVDDSWTKVIPTNNPRERPYLLYVGLVKPHKNLIGLLRAFEKIAPNFLHDLVIVGDRDKINTRDEEAGMYAQHFGERVVFTGWVSDDLLEQYLAHADALVFPSFYEGFGLPPLEAMACGCPVVVSNTASLPEVCGDAALYFDPRDSNDIASTIIHCLTNPDRRDEMRRLGRANAARFTWDDAAQKTALRIEALLKRS